MISENIVQSFIEKISRIKNGQYVDSISRTRDIFDARLSSYTAHSENWLLGAVVGEIGANTFDHNFSFPIDVPKGVFCDFDSAPQHIFMCDFGAGLKDTLSRVVKNIQNDMQAIQIAFTQAVSGRAPEMRGNGLKFVISSVVENKWDFYFQSGNAVCAADGNGYTFIQSDYNHKGCFCILSCKEN